MKVDCEEFPIGSLVCFSMSWNSNSERQTEFGIVVAYLPAWTTRKVNGIFVAPYSAEPRWKVRWLNGAEPSWERAEFLRASREKLKKYLDTEDSL